MATGLPYDGFASLKGKLGLLLCAATGYPIVIREEWSALGRTGTAREWCEENGIGYLEIEASERWESDWKR